MNPDTVADVKMVREQLENPNCTEMLGSGLVYREHEASEALAALDRIEAQLHYYHDRLANSIPLSDYDRLRFRLTELDADLTRMLPKSSNSMSAHRQREITEYVQHALHAALEGSE